MAKPLANGYPIGAVLLRDSIAPTMTTAPRRRKDHVNGISGYLDGRLERLAQWFPDLIQGKVRGRGLLRGVGFKNEAHPGQVVQLARERGVLMLTAGKDAVRLVPSLNVQKDEVEMAVDVLEGCFTVLRG
ncbi:putative acetylornithine aminotransferase [Chiua virens]|nr:putative acetylornithine aminotransferase [Chiua virens]